MADLSREPSLVQQLGWALERLDASPGQAHCQRLGAALAAAAGPPPQGQQGQQQGQQLGHQGRRGQAQLQNQVLVQGMRHSPGRPAQQQQQQQQGGPLAAAAGACGAEGAGAAAGGGGGGIATKAGAGGGVRLKRSSRMPRLAGSKGRARLGGRAAGSAVGCLPR
jgi:hypothetical protein